MIIDVVSELSSTQKDAVLSALTAVETANDPVLARDFLGLQDPTLRAKIEHCLHLQGRVLISVGHGFLSGYDYDVSQRLAEEGIGVLREDDRAVLTLIILHGIAIPRASGKIHAVDWMNSVPVEREKLNESKIPKSTVQHSVQRLRNAGIIRFGKPGSIMIGPQFARLVPEILDVLWENLILLAQPDGMMSEIIHQRRRDQPSMSQESVQEQ
jgi:DNA-binding transcriptional ArsR family regulator